VSGARLETGDGRPEQRGVVSISSGALAAIRAHLIHAYPNEGCGVLIGSTADDRIEISRAAGARNAEMKRGADRFEIEPRDLMAIERELDARRDGSQVVGFFHSHPDAPARPSVTDLEMARGLFDVTRAFYVYAIARVSAGGFEEISYWRLAEELGGFVELNAAASAG